MPPRTTRPAKESSGKRLAAELRGFGPAGLFAMGTILLTGTVIVKNVAIPLGALLVLVWVKLSRTEWEAIGYKTPDNWLRTVLTGFLFGLSFKLLTKSVIMPLLGATPVNPIYHHLAGNAALLPYAIWAMLVAGFAEETVFRGFLFERLRKVFPRKRWAKPLIILLTSFWFGIAHLPKQGPMGAIHGAILGLVFGSIYAEKGRLFFLMIAHAVYDLTALALIYWQWERTVAGFFFR